MLVVLIAIRYSRRPDSMLNTHNIGRRYNDSRILYET